MFCSLGGLLLPITPGLLGAVYGGGGFCGGALTSGSLRSLGVGSTFLYSLMDFPKSINPELKFIFNEIFL